MRRTTWPALVVLATALLWSCANWRDLRNADAPRGWPTTPGVVTESRVADTLIGVYRDHHGAVHRNYVSRLDIRYDYTVNGRAYTGIQLNRWPLLPSQDPVDQSKRYPVHAQVTVHYDPQDPSVAVVDASLPPAAMTQMVLGLVVAVLAAFSVVRRVA